MNRAFFSRMAQIVNILSLSVWLGAVAMSGVVAAIVFPLMRELDPTLGAYPGYAGDHALLGAGRIASTVFFTVDSIQFACGFIALATLAVLVALGYALNTLARVFRLIVLCMTLGLLSYHLFFFMPGLQETLQGYWTYAAEGETVRADAFKDRFLESHGTASRLIGSLALMVAVNIVIGVWTLTAGPKHDADREEKMEPQSTQSTQRKKGRGR
ncbi:MAG: hypothetical protein WD114_00485 [Phycisphaerales bacterium]